MSIEDEYAWSIDRTSEIVFFFENDENDVVFETNIDIMGETQEVQLFLNDQFVDAVTLNKPNAEKMRFIIKSDYLLYGINDFKFVFPLAVSPAELGVSDDERRLAVVFYSFIIGLFDAPVIGDDIFD
jgi:hypothetical protein